jgi:hypothetical protein
MRGRVAPALLLVALLAGCGGGGGGEPQVASTPTETVRTTIAPPKPRGVRTFGGQSLTEADTTSFARKMTRALHARDRAAFVALIDPARPDVVEQQRTWFDNVLKVPMRKREVYLVGNRANIDSSGKHELTADVGFEHQIAGIDRGPVSEWYQYGFRKRRGKLLVTSVKGAPPDTGSGEKSSRYYRQAWDDGPIAVVRGRRAMLVGPEADRGAMQALLATADDAVRRATTGLPGFGGRSGARFLFTVQAPQVSDLFDYFGGSVKPTEANFDGFTTAVYATDRRTGEVLDFREAPVTTRIVLQRDQLGSADAGETMRHEMVHAVTGASGVTDLATWVVEGIAVHFSDASADELARRRASGAAFLASSDTMPRDKTFYDGNDDAVAQRYGASYLAVAYLADRYGRSGLLSHLRSYYRTGRIGRLIGDGGERKFVARVKRWAGA